jgi:hypothetical protein
MLSDCFSVLAILILHRFDLAFHASPMMLIPYSMFLLLYIYIYLGGENVGNFFFFLLLACQILLVFLPDISIHCSLIDYA